GKTPCLVFCVDLNMLPRQISTSQMIHFLGNHINGVSYSRYNHPNDQNTQYKGTDGNGNDKGEHLLCRFVEVHHISPRNNIPSPIRVFFRIRYLWLDFAFIMW